MPGADDSETEILGTAGGPPRATAAAGVTPASLIGRSLGKFTVLERLGAGGSGEVFRAEQVQLGRSAVIKVLRREVATVPNRVERFLREAKLASRLDHPYAAHVYAFGAEPDGVLWIAMEHVRGLTLDELIARRGAMPPALFSPLFGRLCEVVQTMHELGIVHRDIKGSNVMVIERAGQLLPKLLDFGIAKGEGGDVAPGVEGPGAITAHGATLGSPHYMSPEQWRSPGDVDARADIYALGAVAYRCVAGTLPFAGIDRVSLPTAHLEQTPPDLPASVPRALADVILRALAKQPDARWPTALAFGEAVQQAIGGAVAEPVPILDASVREVWTRNGPQPIADAVAHLARATTTVEADAALRELVAIACRWLAVLALAHLADDTQPPEIRERARALVGHDHGAPWLALARTIAGAIDVLPELRRALAAADGLATLAGRLDDRDRARSVAALTMDIAAVADALRPLEPVLAYLLVVGRGGAAESWQGTRRRDRERVVVWGEPLPDGTVALLDNAGAVALVLSPLVQVIAPLPSAEPELFLLWRSGRGQARLVAAPWGFERDDEAAAQRLAALTTEDEGTLVDAEDAVSPYPGLAAYGLADAARFVGREREVETLANRLVRAPMLAVLGPSGAGKSSFMHAGVMARLAEQYELISMRPGRHPMHALAALPPVGVPQTSGSDTGGIVERLRALGERAPRGLVIVIDQLEELVTLCSDPEERARFAETLAAAAPDPSAPVRIVVTLRDDFASVLESQDALRGRFEVFVLAAPSADALRRIVIEPARRAGISVDPRVVEDIVREVAGRPASLPLVSFTASQLWQTRDRAAKRITWDAYEALGGVQGALSTYADQIYGSLARRDQDTVRHLFGRLVASDGTRVPASRGELDQLPGARGVLGHLIDARLLVVREVDGVDLVEIVHECLATRWDRLARWRSEDAADRALLADVRVAARRWQEGGHRDDQLWRGEALVELRKLAARSEAMTAAERAFAQAADRAERRARRLRRALVVASMALLAAVAVVMGSLSVAANRSRSAAEKSEAEARTAAALAEDRLTAGLIAQGRRELNDHRALSALAYFAEVLRRGADTPGLRYMIGLARRGVPNEIAVLHGRHDVFITTLDTGFALADDGDRVTLFDGKGAQVATIDPAVDDLQDLRYRDGKLLAVGVEGFAVIDPATRAITATVPIEESTRDARLGPAGDELTYMTDAGVVVVGLDGVKRREVAIALTAPDQFAVWGRERLYAVVDRELRVVDLRTMAVRTIARGVPSMLYASDDATTLAYLGDDHVAHILDGEGRETGTFRVAGETGSLFVSPDGDQIAVIGDSALVVHDRSGKETRTLQLFEGAHELRAHIVGEHVWTGSTNGVIRHYVGRDLVATLPSHTAELQEIVTVGDLLVSSAFDAAVVIQRADARQVVIDTPPCATKSFALVGIAMGFDCEDGRQVLHVGRRVIGETRGEHASFVAFEPSTGRAVAQAAELFVFDATGKVIASGGDVEPGYVGFESPETLIVARVGDGKTMALWRFTIATQAWAKIVDLPWMATTIATGGGAVVVGGQTQLAVYRDGRLVEQHAVGERVDTLATSGDGRWVSAHLAGGATVIVDTTSGDVARRLEPVETFGIAAVMDATGDLVVRTSRGSLTIWERATGDNLVWNLEFLRAAMGAAFDGQGRLEVVGERASRIDIARETRPVSEILAEIACRVPLRVVGSRLEAAPVDCRPASGVR